MPKGDTIARKGEPMRVLRVLVPPMLFSAFAAAQSAPARVLVMQSQPVQSQPAPKVHGFELSPVTPQAGLPGRGLPAMIPAQPRVLVLPLPPSARDTTVCYAIRSYDFARDNADSDATRLTGSSTCRSASQLKRKDAVKLKAIR